MHPDGRSNASVEQLLSCKTDRLRDGSYSHQGSFFTRTDANLLYNLVPMMLEYTC